MLNADSIKEHAKHLQQRIDDLKSFQHLSPEKFYSDSVVRAAVERHFQVAIECCLDIAKHVITRKGITPPEEMKEVFNTLAKANYLDPEYAKQMTEVAKLRNILVHVYMVVDPEKIYRYLHEDIHLLEEFFSFSIGLLEDENDS